MHAALADRRASEAAQRYVSLEDVGHCPNHEAPAASASILLRWIGASRRDEAPLVSVGDNDRIKEHWGDVRLREVWIEESGDLGLLDRIVSNMVR